MSAAPGLVEMRQPRDDLQHAHWPVPALVVALEVPLRRQREEQLGVAGIHRPFDGVLCGPVFGRLRPLEPRWWREQLYVCPRSGLLEEVPRAPVSRPRFGRVIVLDTRHELREVDGVWQHVTLVRRPERFDRNQLCDAVLGDWLDPTSFDERNRYQSLFGRTHAHAVSLRAPGRRERARIEATAP